jgi:hypothetical protein
MNSRLAADLDQFPELLALAKEYADEFHVGPDDWHGDKSRNATIDHRDRKQLCHERAQNQHLQTHFKRIVI